jgi:DNA-binding NarL/FixJ family response regulator
MSDRVGEPVPWAFASGYAMFCFAAPIGNERVALSNGIKSELLRARTFAHKLKAAACAIQEATARSQQHINSSRAMIDAPVGGPSYPASDEPLTARETQVLKLVAGGETSKEISRELGISIKTVEFHRSNAVRKLRFCNRADIVRYALARGWLQISRAAPAKSHLRHRT